MRWSNVDASVGTLSWPGTDDSTSEKDRRVQAVISLKQAEFHVLPHCALALGIHARLDCFPDFEGNVPSPERLTVSMACHGQNGSGRGETCGIARLGQEAECFGVCKTLGRSRRRNNKTEKGAASPRDAPREQKAKTHTVTTTITTDDSRRYPSSRACTVARPPAPSPTLIVQCARVILHNLFDREFHSIRS